MGRWQNAWFDLLRAFRNGEISQAQFRAITDRHRGLPMNEEALQMLLSSMAAAREDYARELAASQPEDQPA